MKKKMMMLMLAGVLATGACACGNTNEDEATATEITDEATSTEASTETSSTEASTEVATEETKVSEREDYVALEDLDLEGIITLADYKNMTVEVTPIEVTDDNIKTYINNYILTAYPITDRAVAVGDTVTIDYVGKLDGVEFENGSYDGYPLNIGSGTFIDGFEDGLVGVMPGETVDLNLTFPEDYGNEELAGQEVVFTVTVHDIQATTDYDNVTMDEIALMELEYDSKEAIWEAAKAVVEEDAATTYRYNIGNATMEKLLSESTFGEIPELLVEEQVQNNNTYLESVAAVYYGLTLEEYVSANYGMTIDEYNEEIYTQATETVKSYLIMEAMARAEGIEVTDEEIMELAQSDADDYGYESAQAVIDEIGKTGYRLSILQDQILDVIIDNVTVIEVTDDTTETETEAATEVATEATTEATTETATTAE